MATSFIHGLMAEFNTADEVLNAAQRASQNGYTEMDAYSPFPVEGLSEAVGFHKTRLPLIVLIAGLCGAVGGYFLQYYAAVIGYPLNIGGRPLHSWPSFIPITFELTVLCAGVTAAVAMIILNGLPMPYHPVFNVPAFERATRDKFFLCIEAADPKFDRAATENFLKSLHPVEISVVEK